KYNVSDEVERLWPISSGEVAYLPVYIVERMDAASSTASNLPRFLVFSALQSSRDSVLEDAIVMRPFLTTVLSDTRQHDVRTDVADFMRARGIGESEWSLQERGPYGMQVTVNEQRLSNYGYEEQGERGKSLALRDIGQYICVGHRGHCVWVTCEDAK